MICLHNHISAGGMLGCLIKRIIRAKWKERILVTDNQQ